MKPAQWGPKPTWAYVNAKYGSPIHRNRSTIFNLCRDVFDRRTSTGSGLFAHLSRDFEQILGQIVSLRVKALSNINLVMPRYIKKKKAYFCRCFNSILTTNVRTVTGTQIMVIIRVRLLLFLICMKETGRDFWMKIEGNKVTFISKGLTTRCKKSRRRHIELGEHPLPTPCRGCKKPSFSNTLFSYMFAHLIFLGTGRLSPQYKKEGVDWGTFG